jgi:serine/threonine protein kinase
MTERRVLGRMRHPFIIRLHWAISVRSTLSLVLDYCPAGDLYFHLRKDGTFEHERVRLYAAEVLLAIQVRVAG